MLGDGQGLDLALRIRSDGVQMDELERGMEKLKVGDLDVGDVVRLSPDAKKSPIKMRNRDLYVQDVSRNGLTITYSPKKKGGTKEEQSTTTPDRALVIKHLEIIFYILLKCQHSRTD
eukprot:SAG22_NODE_94_length_20824_cov_230.693718_6_plen_117_part_00